MTLMEAMCIYQSKQKHHSKWVVIASLTLVLMIIGLWLGNMGYVKLTLRWELDQALATKSAKNLHLLKKVSVDPQTYHYLKTATGSKIRRLSDFQGGDQTHGYYAGLVKGKGISVWMVDKDHSAGSWTVLANPEWRIESLQVR
ncbi:MAG: hypothetical protein ABF679_12130 [Lentilactobacillus diolivorans]